MFVAGLGTATTPIPGPSGQPAPIPPPSGASAGPSPPPPTPPTSAPTAPNAAPIESGSTTGAPPAVQSFQPPPASLVPPATNDPFGPLLQALRKTLVPKKGFSLWDNTRGANNDFHVVLVDKNIRFPPIKARPPSTPQQPMAPLHSPISPLSPSSPLYPDGIMAPIWIRKHRELVPSIFVLVLRLGEHLSDNGPLDVARKEDEERVMDAELVSEVVERKRSTLERGIKLAVVLVCSRRLLDDPSLDSRLSLIRRQSGLDSRASLFVISPVPTAEVVNFVLSFRAELFPAALDYYREHGRRVRRKRARQVPKGKLSDKGWNVRYDYKMGIFSEMRGEMEVALKHYEDSYDSLADMFPAPSLLTARTKRWAEAKVLADCLTVKICKVYLYLNEPSRSVAQLNRHVAGFRELSTTWNIGEDTFEFWSWLSKQYRLFSDLVAVAIRSGFRLPSLRPPPAPRPTPPGVPSPNSPGLVPCNVLFHPGYYFYLSGLCAVQRKLRFRAVANVEPPPGQTVSAAIAHEMKVDHSELIIDLFTKAYEFFKAHKSSRMALFIASQIAVTHFEAQKYELALKFIERIGRTYRRERWGDILDWLSQLAFQCASQIEDHEAAIRILFPLLVADSHITLDQRTTYAADLLRILQEKQPKLPEKSKVLVDMTESSPLIQCHLAFWQPCCDLGQNVPFQLTFTSPPGSRSADLNFSQLAIQFNDGRPPLLISHAETPERSEGKVIFQHLGEVGYATQEPKALFGDLTWRNDSVHVFTGTVAAAREIGLTATTATLTLPSEHWTVELEMRIEQAPTPVWRLARVPTPITLLHDSPAICIMRPRETKVDVAITYASPANLDEEFPIEVEVINTDVVEIEAFLEILVQPGEADSRNQIIIDDQSSLSLIKALPLGVISPSRSLRKTFKLLCNGSPGERSLDVSVRAQPTAPTGASIPTAVASSSIPSSTETLRTLTIPAVPPLLVTFDTHVHNKRRPAKALLDSSQADVWEGASEVTLIAKLCSRGPWDLEVLSLKISCENAPAVRVTASSFSEDQAPLVWKPRDLFNVIYSLNVMPALAQQDRAAVLDGAVLEVLWRRRDTSGAPSRTLIPLPSPRPLPLQPSITLRIPSHIAVHQVTNLAYRLYNPTDSRITLSLQVESAENFVLAGSRKIPNLILAPAEERLLSLAVIPLVVGTLKLPRLRVFEQGFGNEDGTAEEDGSTKRTVRELEVVAEQDVEEVKDPAQVSLEDNLRVARSGDDPTESLSVPFTVLVLAQ